MARLAEPNRDRSVKPLIPEMLLILYRKARFNSSQIVSKPPLLSQLRAYRKEHRPFIGLWRKVFPAYRPAVGRQNIAVAPMAESIERSPVTPLYQSPFANYQQKRGLYRIVRYRPRIACTCVTAPVPALPPLLSATADKGVQAGTSDANLLYQPRPHILLRLPPRFSTRVGAAGKKQWGPFKTRLTVTEDTNEYRQSTSYLNRQPVPKHRDSYCLTQGQSY